MPSATVHGKEYPISKIFGADFAYSIPNYQRPYAWTTEHAGELLDDLLAYLGQSEGSVDDAAPYFLGSIVLIKEETSPESDVVDGQQRLTTLTILLAALRERLGGSSGNNLTTFLYEEGNELLGTQDRYRVTLRPRDQPFFQEFVQSPAGISRLAELRDRTLSDAQTNIVQNAQLYLEKLEEIEGELRRRLAEFVLRKCILVVVSTSTLDFAFRIFSVLNDRGLDLSHADILKAEIIGGVPASEQESYTQRWEDIEEELGRDLFEGLFAHIRMIYRRSKLRETVLKEFRDYVIPKFSSKEIVDDVIVPFGEALGMIQGQAYESTGEAASVNELLSWLSRIDNSDWLPPAILFMQRHRNDTQALRRFYTELERLAAIQMITRFNINQRIERYGKLLASIDRGDDLFSPSSPLQLSREEIRDAVAQLDGNLYLMPFRLYVLLRLDAALSTGEARYEFPTITVEHVLPQTPGPDSQWFQWFPREEDIEQHLHRMGNLVLLNRRKNSAASNYEFARKKTEYFSREGVSPFAITTQVLGSDEWTPATLAARQTELLAKCQEIWRL